MKNENNADTVLKRMKKRHESLASLKDVIWRVNQRSRKIKIIHRALWHLADESCIDILPKGQQRELYEIFDMLNHHQERLEDFLGEATKYCDHLEQ